MLALLPDLVDPVLSSLLLRRWQIAVIIRNPVVMSLPRAPRRQQIKLLATMLLTELSGHDLYSTSNVKNLSWSLFLEFSSFMQGTDVKDGSKHKLKFSVLRELNSKQSQS